MDSLYDYKKFALLYVDDEEKSLKNFTRAFNDQFRILTAPNAQEGLRLLEAHQKEIGLLMTDQRMPGEKGVWLLEKARQLQPRIIRILATACFFLRQILTPTCNSISSHLTRSHSLSTRSHRNLEFGFTRAEWGLSSYHQLTYISFDRVKTPLSSFPRNDPQ